MTGVQTCALPIFVIPGFFTGPLAAALGGVDISAIVGLAVSAATYFALTRSLDVGAEVPAIAESERRLVVERP